MRKRIEACTQVAFRLNRDQTKIVADCAERMNGTTTNSVVRICKFFIDTIDSGNAFKDIAKDPDVIFKKTKQSCVFMPDSLIARLVAYGNLHGMTLSQVVRLAVDSYGLFTNCLK